MKLLETRKREGYTYRLYRLDDGTTKQTYEIGAPLATDVEIVSFIRQLKRRAAGRANMVPGGGCAVRGISIDPDRIDAVLEDALNPEMRVADVCLKHKISSKTYYKILRGA